jgi:hypothetical protein
MKLIGPMLAIPIAATVLSAPAHADADYYLRILQTHGITIINRDIAIKQGLWSCQALASGQSIPAVTQAVLQQNPTLAWNQALMEVGLAQKYLCS